MATRSRIGMKNADGTYTSIYCHWDGYPDSVGKTLFNHYTDFDKVKQLMGLGDISSLGAEIGEKHDFDKAPDEVCNVYGRDRGETDVDAHTSAQLNDLFREEYAYIFEDGKWYWWTSHERPVPCNHTDCEEDEDMTAECAEKRREGREVKDGLWLLLPEDIQ